MARLTLPREHIFEKFPSRTAFNIYENGSLFHGSLESLLFSHDCYLHVGTCPQIFLCFKVWVSHTEPMQKGCSAVQNLQPGSGAEKKGVLYLSTDVLAQGVLLIGSPITHLDCLVKMTLQLLRPLPEVDVVLWSLQCYKLRVLSGSSLKEIGRINGTGPLAVGQRKKIHVVLMVFRKESVMEETCYRDTGLTMRPKRHHLAH